MNATAPSGNWNETKDKLKKEFALLTENDLLFSEGTREDILEKIQLKLGKTKEELQAIISAL